jgi:hypothetical protein
MFGGYFRWSVFRRSVGEVLCGSFRLKLYSTKRGRGWLRRRHGRRGIVDTHIPVLH